jgi:carboxypeptidase C (cathepsin A)
MLQSRSLLSACFGLGFLLASYHAIRILPSDAGRRRDSSAGRRLSSEDQERTAAASVVPVKVPDSPDGHLVTSLPLLDPKDFGTRHWAGHLPASARGDKYFFYWLFEPDPPPPLKENEGETVPLLIWLNGGPGCSSMDGLFLENGPLRLVRNPVTDEYQLKPDPYSWHKLPAYTLYIDQPVGTGLSFTTGQKYPSNDEELNADFYYFLQSFLAFHSDKFVVSQQGGGGGGKTLNRPLFFSGESYAGHYETIYVNYR